MSPCTQNLIVQLFHLFSIICDNFFFLPHETKTFNTFIWYKPYIWYNSIYRFNYISLSFSSIYLDVSSTIDGNHGGFRAPNSRKAIYFVDEPKKIGLIADFTRTEILRLLSTNPMTETKLSRKVGMTKAAVGYHLHLLLEAELIHIDRVQPEKHGILQKFYAPIADMFIVDADQIPKNVVRYFLQEQIEHLRGMFSVFQLYHRISEGSSRSFEKLAVAMLKQLKTVGQNHVKDLATGDAESLRVKIYAEALSNLTKQKEWDLIFQGSFPTN